MATAAARPEPRRAPVRAPKDDRTRLKVLSAQALTDRSRARRARSLIVASCLLVAGSLLAITIAQTMVAAQQLRIDNLNQAVTGAVAANQNLALSRAQLAAPARILQIAEHRLGMVTPSHVTYFAPVDPGPSLSAAPQTSAR